jgi:hypothetical protein
MRFGFIGVAALLALLGTYKANADTLFSANPAGGGYNFSIGGTYVQPAIPPVTYPGSLLTVSYGTNAAGEIVGQFNLGTGNQGFLYNAGTFTTIDVPGSTGTEAYAINNVGQIAGVYTDSHGFQNGFLYSLSSNAFTTINVPGAGWTQIYGLNDVGQIVGDFTSHPGGASGFVDTSGIFTQIDITNAQYTTVDSIGNTGVLTGNFRPVPDSTSFEAVTTVLNPAVPEPSTWAMMILGFLGLGWLAYRRKNRALHSTLPDRRLHQVDRLRAAFSAWLRQA